MPLAQGGEGLLLMEADLTWPEIDDALQALHEARWSIVRGRDDGVKIVPHGVEVRVQAVLVELLGDCDAREGVGGALGPMA